MPEIELFEGGNVPADGDSLLITWQKILGKLNGNSGTGELTLYPDTMNIPLTNDDLLITFKKVLGVLWRQ